MLKLAGRSLIISALLCQMGAHLVILQAVAWARMSIRGATSAPCELCLKVQKDAQSHKKQEAKTSAEKLDFHLAASRRLPRRLSPLWVVESLPAVPMDGSQAGETPPPEAAAA